MNKTPLVEFLYNRHKTASATKEAAVKLRVTFESISGNNVMGSKRAELPNISALIGHHSFASVMVEVRKRRFPCLIELT